MNRARVLIFIILSALLIALPCAQSLPFRNLKVGEELPPVTLSGGPGPSLSLEELKGKVSIFFFARPGESLSGMAGAALARVVSGAAVEEIRVLAIVPEGAEKASSELGSPFTVIVDKGGHIAGTFGLIAYPSTAVMDRTLRLACYQPLFSEEYAGKLSSCLLAASGKSSAQGNPTKTNEDRQEARRRLEQARELSLRGATEEAEKYLRETIGLYPQQGDAHLSLGLLLLKKGDLQGAKSSFQQAISLMGPLPQALVGLGITLRRLGDLDKALQLLTQALVNNTSPARCHYEMGRVFEAKGDWENASKQYLLAIEGLINPSG